jgi:hypothetical protein
MLAPWGRGMLSGFGAVTAESVTLIGGTAFLGGSADPNAGSGTALPSGASTGIYQRTDGSVWVNLTGAATGWLNTRAAGDSDLFGDGSGGDLSVTGTTTEAGGTDPMYDDITVGASGIYNTAGRRIFVRGTLTITSGGEVRNLGNNASGATAGTAAASYTLFGGTAGGNGGTAAGTAGTNASASTRCISPSQHGLGGAGGAGSGGAGAAAGTQQAVATTVGGMRSAHVAMLAGFFGGNASQLGFATGMGGGGGGGDGANAGGGGGGGGGNIMIIARRVVTAGATPFSVAGGNGAAGTATNCGGGGGGGGGTIVIVTRQYDGTALTAATHCAGGALGASGGGSGVAGSAGGNGIPLVLSI